MHFEYACRSSVAAASTAPPPHASLGATSSPRSRLSAGRAGGDRGRAGGGAGDPSAVDG